MLTRLAAWWITGPLGHLAAGLADWAQLLAVHLSRNRQRAQTHR